MPQLHNPADCRLFCYRIERILEAGESVEITDEEAADLEGNTVFVIQRDEAPAEPEVVEEPAEEVADAEKDAAEDDGEEQPRAAPKRTTAKRGSRQVEVTEAPDVETRG